MQSLVRLSPFQQAHRLFLYFLEMCHVILRNFRNFIFAGKHCRSLKNFPVSAKGNAVDPCLERILFCSDGGWCADHRFQWWHCQQKSSGGGGVTGVIQDSSLVQYILYQPDPQVLIVSHEKQQRVLKRHHCNVTQAISISDRRLNYCTT